MDRHAGWQSPSYELPSDAEMFTRQPAVPEACPPRPSCSSPSKPALADDNMRACEDDSSAFMPDETSTLVDSDNASTSCTRQTVHSSPDEAPAARSGQQRAENTDWRPGQLAMYEQRSGNGAQRFVTVQVTTANRVSEGGMVSSTDSKGEVAVTDGVDTFFVSANALTELVVPNGLVARLQSGAGTSPSTTAPPTSQQSVQDVWEWLTPVGLAQAKTSAVPVPKEVVPHLVGKGGATIRMIENTIGIIIGIMDGQDGQARISLAGPQHKVAAAQQLIQIAAGGGGAWSLLHRIKDRGPLFV